MYSTCTCMSLRTKLFYELMQKKLHIRGISKSHHPLVEINRLTETTCALFMATVAFNKINLWL